MGETPFILTYVSKAMLPIDVALPTHHLITFQEALSNIAPCEALNLLPSVQGDTLLREAIYMLCITRLHDRVVKLGLISIDDMVLLRTEVIARVGEHGELTAN